VARLASATAPPVVVEAVAVEAAAAVVAVKAAAVVVVAAAVVPVKAAAVVVVAAAVVVEAPPVVVAAAAVAVEAPPVVMEAAAAVVVKAVPRSAGVASASALSAAVVPESAAGSAGGPLLESLRSAKRALCHARHSPAGRPRSGPPRRHGCPSSVTAAPLRCPSVPATPAGRSCPAPAAALADRFLS
jgi:hypothetical protein